MGKMLISEQEVDTQVSLALYIRTASDVSGGGSQLERRAVALHSHMLEEVGLVWDMCELLYHHPHADNALIMQMGVVKFLYSCASYNGLTNPTYIHHTQGPDANSYQFIHIHLVAFLYCTIEKLHEVHERFWELL